MNTKEIVERLRAEQEVEAFYDTKQADVLRDAAHLIEAQEAENARLREALERIERQGIGAAQDWSTEECCDYWANLAIEYRRIARQSLQPKDTDNGR